MSSRAWLAFTEDGTPTVALGQKQLQAKSMTVRSPRCEERVQVVTGAGGKARAREVVAAAHAWLLVASQLVISFGHHSVVRDV